MDSQNKMISRLELSLAADPTAVKANIAKAISAESSGIDGYFRSLSLKDYETFCPTQYDSLSSVIDEIIARQGGCRILEIGMGEGAAAQEITVKYGDKVRYSGLDVVEPLHRKGVEWISEDMDSFQPDAKYDLIFSINGLIYGHNDAANLFKFANALSQNGKFMFNFDGCSGPLKTEKANKFSNFMRYQFLEALYEAGMHSYCENNGLGRWLFFGVRKNEHDLDHNKIIERAKYLESTGQFAYVKTFGKKQHWVNMGNWRSEIKKAVEEYVIKKNREFFLAADNILEERERNGFVWWLADHQSTGHFILELNSPINIYVDARWKHHPSQKREQ